MTEKKKIGLKKQDFKWTISENENLSEPNEIPQNENSLSAIIKAVNQDLPKEELNEIAKDRKDKRDNINNAVESMSIYLKNPALDESNIVNNRSQLQKDYQLAIENIEIKNKEKNDEILKSLSGHINVDESDFLSEKTIDSTLGYIQAENKNIPKSISIKNELNDKYISKEQKSINPAKDIANFKSNVSELWKSVLGIAILLIAIVVGISYKHKPANNSFKEQNVLNSNNIAINNNDKKDFLIEGSLVLEKLLPPSGTKTFQDVSLADWSNIVNLKDVPKNMNSIISTFPQNLYRKIEKFTESLIIYDQRTVEQERFVRKEQFCYYNPDEYSGSWMDLKFYFVSYCFLNNKFIGFNLYTSPESDTVKKVESIISKYSFLHISSIQNNNGFNIISIEQNQSAKILEDYKISLLNN